MSAIDRLDIEHQRIFAPTESIEKSLSCLKKISTLQGEEKIFKKFSATRDVANATPCVAQSG